MRREYATCLRILLCSSTAFLIKYFNQEMGNKITAAGSVIPPNAIIFPAVKLDSSKQVTYIAQMTTNLCDTITLLQSAVANGHRCGGKRPQCGAPAASLN